ncbi:MAG: hypothetical protein JWR69_4514, partial [Pedosphaera sp.]|nr:hypothetical protein [Pedosphaera sp.]
MTPYLAMTVDPWILALSLVTVAATIGMGLWSARSSKTAGDFFVAGRSVSVGWNASAISGEYLSAASFMGIAGMVMKNGYDALWYPVCYACGYLFLLLFIAGPLRRFGAYTIPDFAEGRYDSPLFRKIAVIFVLFIGFFYTMPQMKGAGTTLAYVFPGLDYRWGVILVGAVITLNVALGGMKGITLVQAIQYWVKMFAISVPVFVLASVYGGYGKQLELNGKLSEATANPAQIAAASQVEKWLNPPGPRTTNQIAVSTSLSLPAVNGWVTLDAPGLVQQSEERVRSFFGQGQSDYMVSDAKLVSVLMDYANFTGRPVMVHTNVGLTRMLGPYTLNRTNWSGTVAQVESFLARNAVALQKDGDGGAIRAITGVMALEWIGSSGRAGQKMLPEKAPKDEAWLNPFGPLTTKAANAANAAPRWNLSPENRSSLVDFVGRPAPTRWHDLLDEVEKSAERLKSGKKKQNVSQLSDWTNMPPDTSRQIRDFPMLSTLREFGELLERPVVVATNLPRPKLTMDGAFHSRDAFLKYLEALFLTNGVRLQQGREVVKALPAADWDRYQTNPASVTFVPLRLFGMHANVPPQVLAMEYAELLDKTALIATNTPTNAVDFNPKFEVMLAHEAKAGMEKILAENGISIIPAGPKEIWAVPTADLARYKLPAIDPRPYSLLYTYSLIIALVCGTAGLPHILVRFYTNPNGVAAKRTTMWVMILIGVFYLFPPVLGVLGRNLLPELYSAVGAKGTDKVVLELPSLLNQKYPGLGSVLSGIACAGAFAAFMSTFCGLLVSMTGALA